MPQSHDPGLHVTRSQHERDTIQRIAQGIVDVGSDFSHGKPDQEDFVRVGWAQLDRTPSDLGDRIQEAIADELFEDSGEHLSTELQMAAYIYARLSGATPGLALGYAAPWTSQ